MLYCFLFQENSSNTEIPAMLKHIRPGDGYEPKFPIHSKIDVNGANAHPLFQYLREQLPTPSDDPASLMANPEFVTWKPVTRNDIAWNFEKFLIDKDGVPFKRYSKKFITADLKDDINVLLK